MALTANEALDNAARILRHAEAETNHATMERLESLADSWITIGNILLSRDEP